MTSHELARLLLRLPDIPVATHTNNHTHHGLDLAVCVARNYTVVCPVESQERRIIIGNISTNRDFFPDGWTPISPIFRNGEKARGEWLTR